MSFIEEEYFDHVNEPEEENNLVQRRGKIAGINKVMSTRLGITGRLNAILTNRYEDILLGCYPVLGINRETFLEDLENQIEYVSKIYSLYGFSEEEALKSINRNRMISRSKLELERKTAILNQFNLLEYSYFEDPYLLTTELLSEKSLYSVLRGLQDKNLTPDETVYKISEMLSNVISENEIVNEEIEEYAEKYPYTTKQKGVNIYMLSRKLKNEANSLIYKGEK